MESKHEFLCHCSQRKRLFLHIPTSLMEFFDDSPAIIPKTSIRQPKRKKKKRRNQKREGGICPIARRADILVKT